MPPESQMSPAEHGGADPSTGAKEVTCSAAPGTAALAASLPAD